MTLPIKKSSVKQRSTAFSKLCINQVNVIGDIKKKIFSINFDKKYKFFLSTLSHCLCQNTYVYYCIQYIIHIVLVPESIKKTIVRIKKGKWLIKFLRGDI